MSWQLEKHDLISSIKWMGEHVASINGCREIIEKEVNDLAHRIEQWNERDIRVNMDEYCSELQYSSPQHQILYQKLIEKLNLRNGQRVLEVGVGMGDFSLQHMQKFDYYAVDSSLFCVHLAKENARKLGIPQNRIQYSPEGNFNFNEEFDATFCVSVIHEAKDSKDLLRRMAKSLKNNGRIATIERITDILETPEHYRVLLNGEKEISAILQELGFHTKIENFFASYSGCNLNQKYRFSLILGEK